MDIKIEITVGGDTQSLSYSYREVNHLELATAIKKAKFSALIQERELSTNECWTEKERYYSLTKKLAGGIECQLEVYSNYGKLTIGGDIHYTTTLNTIEDLENTIEFLGVVEKIIQSAVAHQLEVITCPRGIRISGDRQVIIEFTEEEITSNTRWVRYCFSSVDLQSPNPFLVDDLLWLLKTPLAYDYYVAALRRGGPANLASTLRILPKDEAIHKEIEVTPLGVRTTEYRGRIDLDLSIEDTLKWLDTPNYPIAKVISDWVDQLTEDVSNELVVESLNNRYYIRYRGKLIEIQPDTGNGYRITRSILAVVKQSPYYSSDELSHITEWLNWLLVDDYLVWVALITHKNYLKITPRGIMVVKGDKKIEITGLSVIWNSRHRGEGNMYSTQLELILSLERHIAWLEA